MFVGFYEAGVEMIRHGKRTVSTTQVELWDLGVFGVFFVGLFLMVQLSR